MPSAVPLDHGTEYGVDLDLARLPLVAPPVPVQDGERAAYPPACQAQGARFGYYRREMREPAEQIPHLD